MNLKNFMVQMGLKVWLSIYYLLMTMILNTDFMVLSRQMIKAGELMHTTLEKEQCLRMKI
jgi:hypothetical protein